MKKLLSREPTPEMVRVALDRYWKTHDVADLIRAMWDAAPASPEPGEIEKFLRETAQKWRDLGAETDAVFNENAADLIAALRVDNSRLAKAAIAKDTPKPGEVERWLRECAVSIPAQVPEDVATDIAKGCVRAADLIAALRSDRDAKTTRMWELGKKCDELEAENERLKDLLAEALDDYIKVGYGASHEDVEAVKEFRDRVRAAIDAARKPTGKPPGRP